MKIASEDLPLASDAINDTAVLSSNAEDSMPRPAKKEEEVKTLLRVPAAIYAKVASKAEASRRSINSEIVIAIEKHVGRKKGAE